LKYSRLKKDDLRKDAKDAKFGDNKTFFALLAFWRDKIGLKRFC
jgi:hypothetical protein